MDLAETLLASERRLAQGNGDTYRETLVDEAVVVVPGMVLDKDACAEAIDASGGWDEVSLDDERVAQLADGVAALTYRFTGRRGDDPPYTAIMTSVYARRDGTWRLAVHQQTPLPRR